jgi:3-hydroxymyristoyl/3-hydroxydecanoyl-(acyl carrier protein) dehydratase
MTDPGRRPGQPGCGGYTLRVPFAPESGVVRVAATSAPNQPVRFRVNASGRCFDGHFDGAPILPGVVQLAMALDVCAAWDDPPGRLLGVRDVRFSRPILPGDEVDVLLTAAHDPATFRFEIRADGEAVTSGLLLFAPAGAA